MVNISSVSVIFCFSLSCVSLAALPVLPRALIAECCAGYVGGVCKQAVTHPFETVATLQEVQRGTNPTAFSWKTFVRDPSKLYTGFLLTVLLNLPYAILFHSSMYWSKTRLAATGLEAPMLDLIAGAAAASVACVVGVPLETIKHRMQVRGRGYGTSSEAIYSSLSSPRELYAGLYTTLLRNVPYNAVQWGAYAFLRRLFSPFLAGACAGVVTALATNPIDVVNTRLQTQAVLSKDPGVSGAANQTLYRGPVNAVRAMICDEGPAAFWRGAGVRAAGYAPSALVFFSVYGFVIRAVENSLR
mmetsp:Transcript_51984/g.104267  ORF Transcript_51984/g.104267 Transcript_51984/m.104267 type:complete len:301 (+) Transcript_51984:154-1056(+)